MRSISKFSVFEILEDRVLFDGVPDATFILPQANLQESVPAQVQDVQQHEVDRPRELIIVDPGVSESRELLSEILKGKPDSAVEVRFLDANQDGVSQITEMLANSTTNYNAIHIISHGSEGAVYLGNGELTGETLNRYTNQLSSWSQAMTEGADLLFYGCELAGDEAGRSFVEAISAITGADVAASDDLTGNTDLGGDWKLEHSVGDIDHAFVLQHSSWFGVLSTVTGFAYIDYDGDGNRDVEAQAKEVGIGGILVTGYDANGEVVDRAKTRENGSFSLNNLGNVAMRVEFTNVPTGFTEGVLDPATADPNAVSSIAFTTGTSNSVMNLALHAPSDISDPNNLSLVATCYFFGDGATGDEPAIIRFDYTHEGDYAQIINAGIADPGDYTVIATIEEVGAVGGLAYQRDIDTYFAGANMKRHAGFGPGGTGAIYAIQGEGTPFVFANLPNADDPHPTSTIGDESYTADWEVDANSFDAVGKIGIGDVDLSEDGTTLWATNLHDRMLYEIPLGNADSPLDINAHDPSNIVAHDFLSLILEDDPGALGINPTANIRPAALGIHGGKVYIGMVNTAQYDLNGDEGNLTVSDMFAYVYQFDPANPDVAPEKVLEFSLDYKRQGVIDASFAPYAPGAWNPWQSTWPTEYADGTPIPDTPFTEIGFPMPLMSDIEFDNDGSMILGFRDRFGDQGGYFLPKPDGTGSSAPDSGGEILRANFNAGSSSWEIESNLVPNDGTPPDSGDTSIEFYHGEVYGDGTFGPTIHNETAQGGLAFVPGYSEVVTSAMDPVDELFFSGGFIWLDNTTGDESTADGRSLGLNVYTSTGADTFAKGNGLGDVEVVTSAPNIEVGDRIWIDSDEDGIQDADEQVVPDGVVVEIYDMSVPQNPVLVGTTTTRNGQYLFNDSNVRYSNGAIGLNPFTDYEIRIPESEFAAGGSLEGAQPTIANQGDNDAVDSDAYVSSSGHAVVRISTGQSGANDHSYDIGILPVIDLEVNKMVSNLSPQIGETVTWTITVTNNAETALAAASGVVIQGVMPFGQTYVNESADVPGSGSFNPKNGLWTVGEPIGIGETVTLTFDTVVGLSIQADDFVDLELTAKVSNESPLEGEVVQIVYTLENNAEGSTSFATGVSIADLIPAGMTYGKGRSSIGKFNAKLGTWDLSESVLMPGQKEQLTILARVNEGTAGSAINLKASVAAVNETDIDSIAGNEAGSEDDDATLTLNVIGKATRDISGSIFLDSSVDGIKNESEGGIKNVLVKLYDRNGHLVGTTETKGDGTYSFKNVTNDALRVEFENWSINQSGTTAANTEVNLVSSIAFLEAASGNAVMNLAIYKPADSAEFVTSCFVFQGAENLDPETAEAIIVFNSDGTVKRTLATIAEVGSVNGIGFHQPSGNTFAAAFHRRLSDVGPEGNDAIYRIDDFGNLTTFINLDDFFGPDSAGPYSHDPSNWAVDLPAVDAVGKVAFGDVDISDDGRYLYTVNLYDNRIYQIQIGADGDLLTPQDYSVGDGRTIERFNILLNTADSDVGIDGSLLGIRPDLNLRPYALSFHEGLLYVGMINSGQFDAAGNQTSLGDASNMQAYVFTFDPQTQSFSETPALTFGFENVRESDGSFNGNPPPLNTQWNSWQDRYINKKVHQPWLSDIEFDHNGDMIIGIRDRLADQAFGLREGPADRVFSAGDILRAERTTELTWQIEEHVRNLSLNEYYTGDRISPGNPNNGHFETGQGGLVQIEGFNAVASTVMDPERYNSGGVRAIDNADGENVLASTTIFDISSQGSLGKANGLGDLEYSSNLGIEIGNRVWIDADRDGIQDAGEASIAGVTLLLYDMSDPLNPLLVGTTITNAIGEYYFNDSNVTYSDGGEPVGLRALTDYEIRIDGAEFLSGGDLFMHQITNKDREAVIASGTENLTGVAAFDPNQTGALDTARNQRIDVLGINSVHSDGKIVVVTDTSGGTARVDVDGTVIFEFDAGSTSGSFDYVIVDDRLDSDAMNIDADMDGLSDGGFIMFTTGAEGSTDHSFDIGVNTPQIDLELEKVVDRKLAVEGNTVTFTLFLTNNGENANVSAKGVVVTDSLPDGLAYLFGSAISSHGGSFDFGTGQWTLGEPLGVGETAKLTFQATVGLGTTGAVLISTAEVTSFNDMGGAIQEVDSMTGNDDGDLSEDDEDDAVVFVGTPDGVSVVCKLEVYAADQTDVDSTPDNENHDSSEDDEAMAMFVIQADMGDLPDDEYNTLINSDGPVHLLDGETFLGASVDFEEDGQPSLVAAGDDSDDGSDDEDGISFLDPLIQGSSARIQVTASAGGGFLNAWIDFDGNGTLDEVTVTHINGVELDDPVNINDLEIDGGVTVLTISVPDTAKGGTPARFRFTSDAMGDDRSPTGLWDNGEVEDYILGAIGDTVWLDNGAGEGTIADGIQDPGELGVEGVVVYLLNADGERITDGLGNEISTTTNADGNYAFSGLPQGEYKIEFELPDGYLFTQANAGSDDGADSDADTETGITSQSFFIGPNDSNPTVDAGLLEMDRGDLPDLYSTTIDMDGAAHAIDGVTFLGSQVDGELDGQPSSDALGDDNSGGNDDEDGIEFLGPLTAGNSANIRVNASVAGYLNAWIDFDSNGTLDEVTVTHINGVELDEPVNINDLSLDAGMTTLTIAVPESAKGTMAARFRFTNDMMGDDRAPTGTWGNGEVEDYVLGAIGNVVWEDNGAGEGGVSGDGIQNGTEPGVEGVTVYLLDESGNRVTDPVTGEFVSTVTDEDGNYEFAGLPPGQYSVQFVKPDGFEFTDQFVGDDEVVDSDANQETGVTNSVQIVAGETNNTLDAGVVEFDYGDLPDGYGTTNDSEEGPARHVVDDVTFLGDSVDSEEDGQPSEDALGDGSDEDGVVFLSPLQPGTSANIKITASVNGYLNAWIDFDSDGTLDEVLVTHVNGEELTEPVNIKDLALIQGVTTLTIAVPETAKGTMAARFRFTSDAMGDARSTNGDWDNGEVEDYVLGAIGDVVFLDNGGDGGVGGDGVQNGGEPGVEGVTVYLLNEDGVRITDPVTGEFVFVTTDENGNYSFVGLPTGEYQVQFVLPDGMIFTDANQVANDDIDSDADETDGTTETYSIVAGQTNDSIDAGVLALDMGDLPEGYANTTLENDGAAHGIDGMTFLGSSVDGETDGQPSLDATGDGDDEDGIVFLDPLSPGNSADIKVTANVAGYLNAWIDFDSDGDLDEVTVTHINGEELEEPVNINDLALEEGMTTLTISVPETAKGTMAARFRFTNDMMGEDRSTTGTWDNGEVEDYVLGAIGNVVWEDNGAGEGGESGDGIQNGDEPGVAGVTVYLLDEEGARITDPVTGEFISATTDENGSYAFFGLPPGQYSVEFVEPDGFDFTDQNVGDDDAVDSDANLETGITDPVNIVAGETNNTLDAGIVEYDYGDLPDGYGTTDDSDLGPARHVVDDVTFLGSSVDAENDGQPSDNAMGDGTDEDGVVFLNPLEPGKSAKIEITASVAGFLNAWIDFDSNGVLDEVTVTHVNGEELEEPVNIKDLALVEGKNTLTIAVPENAKGTMAARFRFTEDVMGDDRSPNGDWDNGEVEDYVLGAIGNVVFLDNGIGEEGVGGDGIQNGDEAGVEGVVVMLLNNEGAPIFDANGVEVTTTTDENGNYSFVGLPPGEYKVKFVTPDGMIFTDANQGEQDELDSDAAESNGVTETYLIQAGQTNDTIDAGLLELDLGDLPEGYANTLLENGGAAHGIDGETYLGSGVDAETDGQPSDDATGDGEDEDGVEFLSPLTAGNSAVIKVSANVAGFLNAWIDFDSDGDLDEVTVTHINGEELEEPVNINDLALEEGMTTLTITVPETAKGTMAARFRFTDDMMGVDRAATGTWDNGEVEDYVLGAIGNVVWEDNGAGEGGESGDGIQNGDEPGVAGVTVYLLDDEGARITDPVSGEFISTTTDENGNYQFAGLPPGQYSVQFVQPDGFDFTDQNVEENDAVDSDADEETGVSDPVTIVAGETNDTLDAGIVEYDYGDLPDGYGTTDDSELGPARHVVDDVTFLGSSIDSEDDGQPSDDAMGDGEDEDGVVFLNPLQPGLSAFIQVNANVAGFLNAWIDFDSNGVLDEVTVTHVNFEELEEPVNIKDLALAEGMNTLTIAVPETAKGTMAARFRFTEDMMGDDRSPNGDWDNGEVEDYVLGAISDLVFLDNGAGEEGVGGDGIQNGDEAGVEGVVVKLLNAAGTPIFDAEHNPITTTTDENGNYSFVGLPPGEYKVQFVSPDGMIFTDANQGEQDDLDSDAAEFDSATDTQGVTQTYLISAGQSNNTIDAGLLELDLGDLPDEDYGTNLDNDGAAHGIDGMTFLGSGIDAETDGQPSDDATGDGEDEDGIVFLGPLTAGDSAEIKVTANVDGYLNAWIDFDSDGELDEVLVTHIEGEELEEPIYIKDLALQEGMTILTIAVPDSATGTMAARFRFTDDMMGDDRASTGTWDNGEVEDYVLGAIGDQVWEDNGAGEGGESGDGIQNGDEPGLEGITVYLLDDEGQRIVDPVTGEFISTTTDETGNYEFAGLPPGQYSVEFVEPTGFDFTDQNMGDDEATDSDANQETGVSDPVEVVAGETIDDVDAGLVEYDYGDLPDGYGTTDDSEVGPARHVVDDVTFLGSSVDGEDDGQPSDDAMGDGDDEDGVVFLNPLEPGNSANLKITASVDGYLNAWIDFDSDGRLDEVIVTHINGVKLETPVYIKDLSLAEGDNVLTIEVPTTADGTMAARFRFTEDAMGDDRSANGDWDNGEVEDYVLGAVGNLVFLDNGEGGGTAGDGIQNGDEPGVEGVIVNLLDGEGDPVLDADDNPITTTTDENGNYSFVGLPPGEYQVEFIPASDVIFTDPNQGEDDGSDSNVDELSGLTETFEVEAGETDDSIDAGLLLIDMGDLPDQYGTTHDAGGAVHGLDNVTFLGSGVDPDGNGDPTSDATGDLQDDGVTFLSPLTAGDSANIQVEPSVDGYLNAWIDFDSDGVLDEVIVTHIDGVELESPVNIDDLALTGGSHVLTIAVPDSATGTMAARFRFSDDMMGEDRSPTGVWDNGEVEDYVLGSLGEVVFMDNGAGTGVGADGIQSGSEAGVEGVTVILLDGDGNTINDPVTGDPISTTTDENGNYEFAGLPVGEYKVQFFLPTGFQFTDTDQGPDDGADSDANEETGVTDQTYTIEANTTETSVYAGIQEQDFGDLADAYNTTSGTDGAAHGIDGATFLGNYADGEPDGQSSDDAGGDGIDEDGVEFLNPLMPGSLADIKVEASVDGYLNAWIDFNADGVLDEITVTHVNGAQLQTPVLINDLALSAGTTTLTISVPEDATGNMPARFRFTSDMMEDARSTTGAWDNGEVEDYILGSIGDIVFHDNGADGGTGSDGIQNGSEPGMPDVVVYLLHGDGTPVVDANGIAVSTTTDENGEFEFAGLPAGDYKVQFVQPDGFVFTSANSGGDEIDSDASYTTGVTNQTYTVGGNTTIENVDAGLLETPSIAIVETASDAVPNGENWDVVFTLLVENIGDVAVNNLSILNDLVDQWGDAFVDVKDLIVQNFPGDGAAPTANQNWLADTTQSMISGGMLNSGDSFEVLFTATIDPDNNGESTPIFNQAVVQADGIDVNGDPLVDGGDNLLVATDASDDGTDPNSENGSDNNDGIFANDPTPVIIADLGLALSVVESPVLQSDGTYEIVYQLVVENTGTVDLSDLSLIEDLVAHFGDGLIEAGDLTITDPPTELNSLVTLNPLWDGLNVTEMMHLTNPSGLEVGDSFTLTFAATVDSAELPEVPVTESSVDGTATATDPAGNPLFDEDGAPLTATDVSDSGDDPNLANIGEPGDTFASDDETPLYIASVGLAKQAGDAVDRDGLWEVSFTLTYENNGTVTLTDLTLFDDFSSQFGDAFVSVSDVTVQNFTGSGTAPVINNAWANDTSQSIISGGTAEVGDKFEVTFNVLLDPTAEGASGPMQNLATASGDAVDENGDLLDLEVFDPSDNGTQPNNENEVEASNDGVYANDPTPVYIADLSIEKSLVGEPDLTWKGSAILTFQLQVENTGTVDLVELSLMENLKEQFGEVFMDAGNLKLTDGPDNIKSKIVLDEANWDGNLMSEIMDMMEDSLLAAGDSFSFEFTAEVDATETERPLITQLAAQAVGIDEDGQPIELEDGQGLQAKDLSDSGPDEEDEDQPNEVPIAIDPAGFFYNVDTGEILTGGSIAVTGPNGASSVNLIDSGNDGSYQFFGTDPGTYVLAVTAPDGFELDTDQLSSGSFDPTGQSGPVLLGTDDADANGFLDSTTPTPYFLQFDLEDSDPAIFLNNLPFKRVVEGATGNPPRLPGLPPIWASPIGNFVGSYLGGPGPIYSGIPIAANANPLSLDSGRAVTGGYAGNGFGMAGGSGDCGCPEPILSVEPCGQCGEPIMGTPSEEFQGGCGCEPMVAPQQVPFDGTMENFSQADPNAEEFAPGQDQLEVSEDSELSEAMEAVAEGIEDGRTDETLGQAESIRGPSFLSRMFNWLNV